MCERLIIVGRVLGRHSIKLLIKNFLKKTRFKRLYNSIVTNYIFNLSKIKLDVINENNTLRRNIRK